MARLSEKELVTICWQELGMSAGSNLDDGSLVQNRREAIHYYKADKPEGPNIPGRSKVVSPDVRNVITNLAAEMVGLWAGEYPAEFEPEDPDDEQSGQAEAETYAVRQVLERCNLDEVLAAAAFDAKLLKNGYVKAWVEDNVSRETRTLDGATAQEIALFMAQLPEEATVRTSGDKATIIIPFEDRRVCVEAVDPTNLMITQNARTMDMQEIRSVTERKVMTRSDAIAEGWSRLKVARVPTYSFETKEDTFTRRLDGSTAHESGATKDQESIEVFEMYLMIDMDGGLEADRWRIMFADQVILERERVNFVPYVSGAILPFPHRHEAQSVFDLTKEAQDIGTAATRQWIDNNATGVQNRLVLGPAINVEDVESAGPNKHIRLERGDDVRSQALPLPFTDVGASVAGLIEYKNQLRGEATGAAVELHSAEPQLLNSQIGSIGAQQVMSAQEAISAMFLRNFATTMIKGLFLLVHRVLREEFNQPVLVRVGDNWMEQDPRSWRPRHAVAVRSGMSTGERNRKVGSLTTHLQVQMQLLQSGSVMVDQGAIHALLMDLARAQELESAEQYYVDPNSERAQQAAQQQQQAQEQQKQEAIQVETLPEQVKVLIARMEDATKRLDIATRAAETEAKAIGDGTTKIAIAQIQGQTPENPADPGGAAGSGQPAN